MANFTRRQILAGLPLLAFQASRARQRPNIILCLIDDLGWTDLGCFGSDYYRTPNIDRFATQSVRFTQAYSACTVCSPSRAGIMTGKYPARLHITDWIPGEQHPWAKLKPPDWTQHLPLEERTMAEMVKPLGYRTQHIGKWHLGNEPFYPEHQGFDGNIGGTFRGQPPSYFSPYGIETLPDGPKGEYLTDREGGEALKFLEENRSRPFFLYLAHHAVHNPLQPKPDLLDRCKSRPSGVRHKNAAYAAMIESVDENFGKVLAKLDELRLTNQTVVIFTSDNGGLIQNTVNSPLRAGKGSASEGGVRVLLMIRWPRHARAASSCDTPVIGIDLYPTVLEMTGATLERGQVIDGESLAGLCDGSRGLRRDAIFWHYPHYHIGGATPYSAIRQGPWRLVQFQENGRVELYNLAQDISETADLARRDPDRANRMKQRLENWRRDISAQMAVANPNYDPARERAVRSQRDAELAD
jgi:arylsulfatase A-like enzyme